MVKKPHIAPMFDCKFWRTLIPLVISPGKISRDYIEGKRNRYSNPFQFYLSISIIFFIILGLTDKYNELNEFRTKTNNIKDSLTTGKKPISFEFDNIPDELSKMISYQRNHSDESINSALDNLGLKKNFCNRFKYSRTTKINSFLTNTTEENKKFLRELISYASISIFVFLPIFTLFLRGI